MLIEWLGGSRPVTGSGPGSPWIARDSAQVSSQSHGKYTEAVRLGNVYSVMTNATGIQLPAALGATSAFTLANPANSSVNLVVLRTSVGWASGLQLAGHIDYAANLNPAAAAVTANASGAALTPINCFLGNRGGVAQAFQWATLPATPTVLRPVASVGAATAATAIQPWQIVEDVDGEFVIRPGCALSLVGQTAAGTSCLMVMGMTWEEVAA